MQPSTLEENHIIVLLLKAKIVYRARVIIMSENVSAFIVGIISRRSRVPPRYHPVVEKTIL